MKNIWSLKSKFILISTVLTTGMILVLVLFTTTVYLNGIKALEIETIERNIDRGKSAYDYLIVNYNSKINDWAQWDDTYQFMDDLNKNYISSNLNDATLQNLSTDEMLFFDTELKLKYAIATDKILESENDFPKDVENFLISNDQITNELVEKGKSFGVLKTEDGKLLFVSQKIVKSDGSGEVRGYLVFGRYLGDWIANDLTTLLQLPVKYDVLIAPDEPYKIPSFFSNQDEKILGHFNIEVLNSENSIVFEIEMERNIWKVGYQGAIYQTVIISILSVVIGLLNYLFLRNVILKDISKFKEDVAMLSTDTSGRLRLDVNSNNYEIKALQESVSKLIEDLNIAKKESDQKAHELDKINKLMVGREIKMTELKQIIADLKKKII